MTKNKIGNDDEYLIFERTGVKFQFFNAGRMMVARQITHEMTIAIYDCAKKVFHNEMNKQEVFNKLKTKFEDYPLTEGYTQNHINSFRKMMRGERCFRLGEDTFDYFLSQILEEYDIEKFKKSIDSLDKYIKSYTTNPKYNWKMEGAKRISKKYKEILRKIKIKYPDDLSEKEIESYPEGGKKRITVNAYERNLKARKKCLDNYGYRCKVCDFSFENFYGEIGKNYIHVHHLIPVSEMVKIKNYQIKPIKDLIPVCPNCHAMLHKKKNEKEIHTIEDLKDIIANNKK